MLADPTVVVDRLVQAVGCFVREHQVQWLSTYMNVDRKPLAGSLRQLIQIALFDVYISAPQTARTWLTMWGTNLKGSTLSDEELSERLVVAIVATLARAKPPQSPGGWFGAWCRSDPTSLYANKSVCALHALASQLLNSDIVTEEGLTENDFCEKKKRNAQMTRTEPDSLDQGFQERANVVALKEDIYNLLWPSVVARFPAAAKWSDRRNSRIAQGFLAALAKEQPDLIDQATMAVSPSE